MVLVFLEYDSMEIHSEAILIITSSFDCPAFLDSDSVGINAFRNGIFLRLGMLPDELEAVPNRLVVGLISIEL
jgi:hypothetical protein